MLVLGRLLDETIDIVDNQTGLNVCEIKILRLTSGKVRLGFTASPRYDIVRGEIDIVRGEIRNGGKRDAS